DALIERYLEREQPYDCAGSAKAEGLGIALIARIETEDPTSLIGLPLIALTELLAEAGALRDCGAARRNGRRRPARFSSRDGARHSRFRRRESQDRARVSRIAA